MIRFVAALIVILLTGTTSVYAQLDGYQLAAENEYLALFYNQETGEIAVLDKSTDQVWYSNPPNRRREEKIARGSTKDGLGAQFTISYFTQRGSETTLDNYAESIVFDQIKAEQIEQGIRFSFTLGQEWTPQSFIPNVMSKKRFDELILNKVASEEERDFLLSMYHLVWFEEMPADYVRVPLTQIDKEQLLGNTTLTSTPENLVRRNAKRELYDNLFGKILLREDVSRRSDITPQIFALFADEPIYILASRISRWDEADLVEIIRNTGFTPADRQPDLVHFGYGAILPNHRVFRMAIEYSLDGENLIVRVPLDELEYPVDAIDPNDPSGPRITLPIGTINVLPYFGAANQSTDGYILVPDGSGALINLNSGRISERAVSVNVYGSDNSIARREQSTHRYPVNLPVFGMNQGEYGFFGVIEQGEAVARIKADVAGRTHSYNVVNAEFLVIPKGTAKLQTTDHITEEAMMVIPQSRPIRGDLKIRYWFLSGKDATYVGMAHQYQQYLVRQGMARRLATTNNIPFYLELVGAIQVQRPILGVPQTLIRPLTTYKHAQGIVDELVADGIDNLHLRYTGWLQGGIDHDFPTSARAEEELGGKQGFLELNAYLDSLGIPFYPDISFQTVSKNSLFDGFFAPRDAARFLDRTTAKVYRYDLATYQQIPTQFRYVLSPGRLDPVVRNFLSYYNSLGVQGLSVGDLGEQLNSNFQVREDKLIDRQQAKGLIEDQLNKLANYSLLTEGGLAYTLPFVDHIVNLPLKANSIPLFDQHVPFYPIAVRGFVNYAGEPINMAQDQVLTKLKTIETGAYPYYQFSYAPASQVKHTNYDYLYAINYQDWLSDALDFYRQANQVLKQVEDQRIVNHQQILPQVFMTTYENGVEVAVNYNSYPVEYADTIIEGESFRLIAGGGF